MSYGGYGGRGGGGYGGYGGYDRHERDDRGGRNGYGGGGYSNGYVFALWHLSILLQSFADTFGFCQMCGTRDY